MCSHTAELPLSSPDTNSENKPGTSHYLNLNRFIKILTKTRFKHKTGFIQD